MDFGDAPFVMVMEADDGVRTATMFPASSHTSDSPALTTRCVHVFAPLIISLTCLKYTAILSPHTLARTHDNPRIDALAHPRRSNTRRHSTAGILPTR